MKTLSTLPFEQAHILRAQLEEAGLSAALQDQNGGGLFSTMQWVRIEVADADFERAQELLKELNAQSIEPNAKPEQASDQQWTENRKKPWDRLAWLLFEVPVLIGLILWLMKKFTGR
jgi:hypothetical protein